MARKINRAVIYTRVSTDEQSAGFSLDDQETRLRQFCSREGINVVDHFQDDASAKSFDRPEWKKMMAFLGASKSNVDALLFVRWDRFSRDTTASYSMIKMLQGLGVEPHAIEQPIDWDVPEQLLLLSTYITLPHVDNMIRQIKTIKGQRRAMREGRWVNNAPIGYKNARDEKNKPVLIPSDKAPFVLHAFQMAADYPELPMEELRRRLVKEYGYQISRNRFTILLKSPIYIGKILLRTWRDEPEELIDGLHEPIVDSILFYKVQRRFNKTSAGWKHKQKPELFLRGHLVCGGCGKQLTGGTSKGRTKRYTYYHCHHCKGTRFNAHKANEDFYEYLNGIEISHEVRVLYGRIMRDLASSEQKSRRVRTASLEKQIATIQDKLLKIDEMYVEGQLEKDSYNRMKAKYNPQISEKQIALNELKSGSDSLSEQLEFAIGFLSNIGKIVKNADFELKHKILVLTFPDKLKYRDGSFRTTPESPIIALFSGKTDKKEGTTLHKLNVVPYGTAYGI